MDTPLTDRLVARILNNPKAMDEFPGLRPYARSRSKALGQVRKTCCTSRASEREAVMGVKQLLISADEKDRERIKAYMGLSSGSGIKVYDAEPGQQPRVVII